MQYPKCHSSHSSHKIFYTFSTFYIQRLILKVAFKLSISAIKSNCTWCNVLVIIPNLKPPLNTHQKKKSFQNVKCYKGGEKIIQMWWSSMQPEAIKVVFSERWRYAVVMVVFAYKVNIIQPHPPQKVSMRECANERDVKKARLRARKHGHGYDTVTQEISEKL